MRFRGELRYACYVEVQLYCLGTSHALSLAKDRESFKKFDFVLKRQEHLLSSLWSSINPTWWTHFGHLHRSSCTEKRLPKLENLFLFFLFWSFVSLFLTSRFSSCHLSFHISVLPNLAFFPPYFDFLPPHSSIWFWWTSFSESVKKTDNNLA